MGVYGIFTKVATGDSSPTFRHEVVDAQIALAEEFYHSEGLTGELDEHAERTRPGSVRVAGPIVAEPNKAELLDWLPRILPSGNLPEFVAVVDKVERVATYSGCKVDTATFSAGQGGALRLSLDVVGKNESIGAAGSFPALEINKATGPWMFHEMVMTIGGSQYPMFDFNLAVSYTIDRERFTNSRTLTHVNPTQRRITLTLNPPYDAAHALYGLAVGGVAVSAVFANGSHVVTFTLPAVQIPRQSPVTAGRGEIVLPMVGIARKSGSSAPLTITVT